MNPVMRKSVSTFVIQPTVHTTCNFGSSKIIMASFCALCTPFTLNPTCTWCFYIYRNVYILICLPYWMLVINSCIPKLSKKQDFLWTSLILIALSAFGKIGVKNITTKTSKHNSFFPDHTSLVLDSEFLQILKTFSILISFDNNKLLPYLDSVIPSTRQEDIVITRSVLHSEHSAHVTIHHQMRWAAIRRYKVITISTNIQLKLPFQNHSIHKKQHGTWVSWVAEK